MNRVPQLAGALAALARQHHAYRPVMLALRLAHAFSSQQLAQRGGPQRAYRAVVNEALKLTRIEVRELLGLREPVLEARWTLNENTRANAWLGVCDGSYKRQCSGAGVLIYTPEEDLLAEIGIPLSAATPVAAELGACLVALTTLSALGARSALLLVDAQSVLCALKGTLPLKYSVEEALLTQATRQFYALEVRLVPRTLTYAADRLAAKWSRH